MFTSIANPGVFFFKKMPRIGIIISRHFCRDPDDAGAVEYRATSGNGTVLFTLSGDSGLVTVASSLDGHRGRIYTLNVQARDAGQ